MSKIVFLTTGFDYAGAEAQVVELAAGLKRKGWEPLIVSMIQPTGFIEELRELGIELLCLNMNKGLSGIMAIWRLRQILRRFRPDVVHSHLVHANLFARIARLFVRMPVLISTAHNINEGGRLRMLLYRLTDPLCDYMTNVSQDAVDRYVRIKASPKSKIKYIPNGINLGRFRSNDSERNDIRRELGIGDSFMWLAVGRLVEAKDYPTMLQAWSESIAAGGEGHLVIVGIGPMQEEIEGLARKLGIENRIRLLGIRKDIPRLMNAADAYLMSSRWEGMPIVLLEAAASELPIVATDVGGNAEVVVHGQSGRLVPPENPGALSAAMTDTMGLTVEERRRMGDQGRRAVLAKFNIDSIVIRWDGIYRELLASRAPVKLVEKGDWSET